ncbi:hypothetical protein I6A94_31020, partial [Frankia sp. CN4]
PAPLAPEEGAQTAAGPREAAGSGEAADPEAVVGADEATGLDAPAALATSGEADTEPATEQAGGPSARAEAAARPGPAAEDASSAEEVSSGEDAPAGAVEADREPEGLPEHVDASPSGVAAPDDTDAPPPEPAPPAEPAPVTEAATPAEPTPPPEPAPVTEAAPAAEPVGAGAAGPSGEPDAEGVAGGAVPDGEASAGVEEFDADEAEPAEAPRAAEAGPAPGGDGGPETELPDPPNPAGGGSGGTPIPEPPEPAAPQVEGLTPDAALGAVAGLPATRLAGALGGVAASARRVVGEARADLAANPPTLERPSGVPEDRDASLPPAPLPPLPASLERAVEPPAGGPGAPAPEPAAPPPAPAPVTVRVPEPIAGGDTKITADDAAKATAAVESLPTTDPALHVDAGPVPTLELAGGEDPAQVADAAESVQDTAGGTLEDGRADARADLGENDVFPQVPKETLTASLGEGEEAPAGGPEAEGLAAQPAAAGAPGGKEGAAAPGGGAAGRGGGEAPAGAVDAIAQEKSGGEIQAATATQGAGLARASQDRHAAERLAQEETDRLIDEEVAASGKEQTEIRREVRKDVATDRADWAREQDALVDRTRTAASAARARADTTIGAARDKARKDSAKEVARGNTDIARERGDAEGEARSQREKARKESEGGGFFSWLGSKFKSFFNGIKGAIRKAFDAARAAVNRAISAAQKLAVAAIEVGRRAVVGAIELGGKALVAAGDICLAGFPAAREKFRKKIKNGVAAATKKVNEAADKLKEGAKKLLDALGKALTDALNVLEKAYTAAVDAVAGVVDRAIKAAKAVVDALVDFAVLAKHIATSPRRWLSNLGAALSDGARNHVWPATKGAVKGWFKAKAEEVVGVGKAILDVLRRGGITFAKIVKMAWAAVKAALPGMLVQLLLEKLVAMLIPAAGAIMLIIDGLKAAWAAAERILAAFKKFMEFLKAVRGGNAGPKFGELVAAVVVAVLEFLASFLLSKLKGASKNVGGTLRAMAGRFANAAKKAGRAVGGAAKAGARAAKAGLAAAGRAVGRGAEAVGRVLRRALPGRVLKLGAKALAKARAGYRALKKKIFARRRKETPTQKLERVVGILRPKIGRWLARGIPGIALRLALAANRLRYRLSELSARRESSGTVRVWARVNPGQEAAKGWRPEGEPLRLLIREVSQELVNEVVSSERGQARLAEMESGRPETRAEYEHLTKQGLVSGADIHSGEDWLIAGEAMRRSTNRESLEVTGESLPWDRRIVPWGGRQGWRVGEAGTEVFEMNKSGLGPRTGVNWEVMGVTDYLADKKGDAGSATVSKILAELGAKSGGDAATAEHLTHFLQTGRVPKALAGEEQKLATVSLLIFGRESGRSPAHPAQAMLTLDLMKAKNDHLKADDVLELMPMSMKGAQDASRALQLQEVQKSPKEQALRAKLGLRDRAVGKKGKELAKREIRQAEAWLKVQSETVKAVFATREGAKKYLLERLREFYRVGQAKASSGPTATGEDQ